VDGHQHPAGGHEEGTVAITESDRIFGTLLCGSAAERRFRAALMCFFWARLFAQNIMLCAAATTTLTAPHHSDLR
jgi:hypothetical protein